MAWKNLRLGTDFEGNAGGGRLGIVDRLGTSLDVPANSVIVASRVSRQVAQSVNGDSVFGSAESKGGRVARDLARGHIVRRLSTNEESITADDGIGGEGRALSKRRMPIHQPMPRADPSRTSTPSTRMHHQGTPAHLEQVDDGPAVQAGLLVRGVDERGLAATLRCEAGVQVELEALGDLVIELDGGLQQIGGGPGLGEGETVLDVDVLALEITTDVGGLAVPETSDLEGDVGRGFGFDLQLSAEDGEVSCEEIVGGLAKVL